MEPFLAQIILFAGNFAPRGWAYCSGQLLSISQHTAVFSLLGTTYGGDGRTTFGLPDLRGRVPVGSQGNSAGPGLPAVPLGQRSGNRDTTLTTQNMPSHTHTAQVTNNLVVAASPADADEDSPVGTFPAGGVDAYSSGAGATMGVGSVAGSLSVQNQNAGSNTSFTNMPPYLGLNYIIALQGIFPSRN